MSVLFFRNPVQLEVYGVQARFLCFKRKISALSKTHAVRRNVKPVEPLALRVLKGL